jgi:hypothetical protein
MRKLSAYTDKNFEFLSHPIEEEKHNLIEHLVEVANYTQKLLPQTDFDIASWTATLYRKRKRKRI